MYNIFEDCSKIIISLWQRYAESDCVFVNAAYNSAIVYNIRFVIQFHLWPQAVSHSVHKLGPLGPSEAGPVWASIVQLKCQLVTLGIGHDL